MPSAEDTADEGLIAILTRPLTGRRTRLPSMRYVSHLILARPGPVSR